MSTIARSYLIRLSPLLSRARLYSSYPVSAVKKTTIADIYQKYESKIPITMCTVYDYISASWAHSSNTDMILIGDSLAMTTCGYESTTDLPFDEFKYHAAAVCRANGPSLIVADMPFGTVESSISTAVENVIDLMKVNSNIASVKIEVGPHNADQYTVKLVRELCSRGLPVMGHIGLTPQRMHSLGGFKVQGNKSLQDMAQLVQTAQILEEAGCWALVLECVPHKLAGYITSKISIPTIGIGAGNMTSGQVLVIADMLGMQTNHVPRFVKKYSDLHTQAQSAISNYVINVEQGTFPETDKHTFKIKQDLWNEFIDFQSEKD